jgi:hypothetical protein
MPPMPENRSREFRSLLAMLIHHSSSRMEHLACAILALWAKKPYLTPFETCLPRRHTHPAVLGVPSGPRSGGDPVAGPPWSRTHHPHIHWIIAYTRVDDYMCRVNCWGTTWSSHTATDAITVWCISHTVTYNNGAYRAGSADGRKCTRKAHCTKCRHMG